jgi:hypothetical protein
MLRFPTDKIADIKDAIVDVIKYLLAFPRFEIKRIYITAVPSTTQSVKVAASELTTIDGAIQIASTATELPSVQYADTNSVTVTYDYGAGTTGRQTITFLLIGK